MVPQLNYYRSQFDRANQALEKAEVDRATANINAASQAAQGMINGVAAMGSQMATPSADGNGTQVGSISKDANGVDVTKIDPKRIYDPDAFQYQDTIV